MPLSKDVEKTIKIAEAIRATQKTIIIETKPDDITIHIPNAKKYIRKFFSFIGSLINIFMTLLFIGLAIKYIVE